MKRKGYNPNEGDMPVILAIHNIVNEQGWTKVKVFVSKCVNIHIYLYMDR
jgi:hypothetical protein